MPRAKENVAAILAEPVKPVEAKEQVDLEDNDMEEEVEYEEVEEVEEYEEEEEIQEEEEDEQEASRMDIESNPAAECKEKDGDEDHNKKHAELLALPPHGSEVYVGGIPHEASEADLKSFCEAVGEVTEVRIMKGKDSGNKGYAFVAYKTRELASKAIEDLNNTEFKGKKVKISTSQAKNKLFIGNIPRTWSEEDLREAVCKVGPGVNVIELVKDPQNSSRNRGFAFVEYYNHACAEFSRKNMSILKFKLDSNTPTVSWADQKNLDSTSQVKAIYVKNLPKDVTQDQLKELFQHHGEITKVILPPAKSGQEKSRYGFVHFAERSAAMKAVKNTERYEMEGQVVECSLAKPPSEKKTETGSNAQKPLLPTYPLRGYGVMGTGYGLPGNYGVAPFGQSMMFGRGPAPPGVSMMPMVLPDGRLGYVLQQPGVPATSPQQRGGNRGGSSSATKPGGDNNRGRRYRPY